MHEASRFGQTCGEEKSTPRAHPCKNRKDGPPTTSIRLNFRVARHLATILRWASSPKQPHIRFSYRAHSVGLVPVDYLGTIRPSQCL